MFLSGKVSAITGVYDYWPLSGQYTGIGIHAATSLAKSGAASAGTSAVTVTAVLTSVLRVDVAFLRAYHGSADTVTVAGGWRRSISFVTRRLIQWLTVTPSSAARRLAAEMVPLGNLTGTISLRMGRRRRGGPTGIKDAIRRSYGRRQAVERAGQPENARAAADFRSASGREKF